MSFRSDLAVESVENAQSELAGVETEQTSFGCVKITRIRVLDKRGEEAIGRPKGSYITVEVPPFTEKAEHFDAVTAIKRELRRLLEGSSGTVLVVGLGNTEITPDALGPRTVARILATRHITGEYARSLGLESLHSVAAIAPGVLGQTGIETSEIIRGIIERVKPCSLIVIDALASRRLSRLGCTVQMSDSGIAPGAGVGNARPEISRATVGIPVIAVGVPTVVDAVTLASDLTGSECRGEVEPRGAHMIVTPQEIDLLIDRAAETLAHAINCALQVGVDPEILLELT